MSLPSDLSPIPTSPWNERPAELPLDIEECRTALWLSRGVIMDAAERLKVSSGRLRRFVASSAYLQAEIKEAKQQLMDIAERNVYDALTDDGDPSRRDSMSRYVLDRLGRERGFGNASSKLNINNGAGGQITVVWGDDTAIGGDGDDAKVIDHG